MPAPLYVSFYTDAYRTEAAQLRVTLDHFGLPHDLQAADDLGSWQANTQRKAGFIADRMLLYRGRPIVWLDADARVRRRPVMFDRLAEQPDIDFAAHWREDPQYPTSELLSGTLYFSGSEAAIDLAVDWMAECRSRPEDWDQICLDRSVQRRQGRKVLSYKMPDPRDAIFNCVREFRPPPLRVASLPASYTLIFDSMAHLGPPVIEQMQASRRLKNPGN